jgi:Protein of unknown function (DUF4232)
MDLNAVARRVRGRAGRRAVAAGVVACVLAAGPAVALAASSGHQSSAIKRCTAANTYVWFALSPSGAAGTIYYPMEFTNTGSSACTLTGWPGVAGINKSSKKVGPAARRVSGPAGALVLRPGQTAHALVGIVEPGIIAGCHSFTAHGFQVYPPNQVHKQFVEGFVFTGCRNKVYMSVYPVAPGIGVP